MFCLMIVVMMMVEEVTTFGGWREEIFLYLINIPTNQNQQRLTNQNTLVCTLYIYMKIHVYSTLAKSVARKRRKKTQTQTCTCTCIHMHAQCSQINITYVHIHANTETDQSDASSMIAEEGEDDNVPSKTIPNWCPPEGKEAKFTDYSISSSVVPRNKGEWMCVHACMHVCAVDWLGGHEKFHMYIVCMYMSSLVYTQGLLSWMRGLRRYMCMCMYVCVLTSYIYLK